MMRFSRMFCSILTIAICSIFSVSARAGGVGTTSGAFLKLPTGARPIGMGETYVAVGDDVQSLGWNPAGLALMEKRQFTFMHAQWLEGIRYESLAYAQPLGGFIFLGGGVDFLDSGAIEKTEFTNATGVTTGPENSIFGSWVSKGTFSVSNVVLTLGGAVDVSGLRWIPVPNVQAGMNIRMLLEKIDKGSTAGAMIDIGALWSPETVPNLTLAALGENLGPAMSGKIPPISFRLGAAYLWLNRNLVTTADYYQPIDNYGRISFGAEYWYKEMIAVRGGYRFQGKTDLNEYGIGFREGISLGAGVRYQIVQLDYAFSSLGFFGPTHRISLTVSF